MRLNSSALLAALCGCIVTSAASAQTITGSGASWFFTPSSFPGATSGIADGPSTNIVDANIGGQGDAFDSAAVLAVNGSYFANGSIIATPTSIATGTTPMSGLNVSAQFDALSTGPILRSLFTFTNTTGGLVNAPVTLMHNFGSDGNTQIRATSSGDTTVTTADRWVVTNDAGGDPENLSVLWSAGGLAPSSVSTTVFTSAGSEGLRADFNLAIGAGQTVSLLFFNQITNDPVGGSGIASNPGIFDALTSDLTAGLNSNQLGSVVNWNVGGGTPPTVPDGAMFGVLEAAAAFVLLAFRHRFRGHS